MFTRNRAEMCHTPTRDDDTWDLFNKVRLLPAFPAAVPTSSSSTAPGATAGPPRRTGPPAAGRRRGGACREVVLPLPPPAGQQRPASPSEDRPSTKRVGRPCFSPSLSSSIFSLSLSFLFDRGCLVYPSCDTPSMDVEHGAHAAGRGITCAYDSAYSPIPVPL